MLMVCKVAPIVAALTLVTFASSASRADDSPNGSDSAATGAEVPLRDPSVLVRLVRSKAVQRDLTLTAEQQQQIAALVDEVEYPLFLLRDLPALKKRDKINQLADKVDRTLKQSLSADQQRRMYEISFRAAGWPAILSPEPTRMLNLSADQSADIRHIIEESQKSADKPIAPADERILSLLNPDQKSELTRLMGATFDFSKVPQVACRAPELQEVTDWINTEPLTLAGQRGRVVALHFFAFGCSNCINNQPHYQAWQEKFADKKVTILGIHTPETKRERDVKNLATDIRNRKITYPIAVDNNSSNWGAWANQIWPAVYLIDKQGYVRYWWYGELNWQGARGEELMRSRIDELLAESN